MLLTKNQIDLFRKAIKEGLIKVVGFDLETSPSKFWGWGTGEQYVGYNQLVEDTETKLITAQYKNYVLDKKSKYLEWSWDNQGGDDSTVVTEIVKILNDADIVVGQNSKAFDYKVLQERAKVLRLPPVNIDFMIDTLTSSRTSFKSMSHKLDYRSKQYGLGGKHKMEFQDWIDIVEGKATPHKKMIPYGLKDNDDTETMFWKDLPYYNLPKATVNKILKLIIKPTKIEKEFKVYCRKCYKGHKKSTDISKDVGGYFCNVCDSNEHVDYK